MKLAAIDLGSDLEAWGVLGRTELLAGCLDKPLRLDFVARAPLVRARA